MAFVMILYTIDRREIGHQFSMLSSAFNFGINVMRLINVIILLTQVRDKFKDGMYIHLEQWSEQPDPDRTEFRKSLVWVEMPGLREECLGMIDDTLSRVGEVFIRPDPSEIWGRGKKPRWAVRVNDVNNLPDSVDIICPDDNETIKQILDYPFLPARCKKSGSLNHLKDACPEMSPWKAALLGRKVEYKGLPGYAGASQVKGLSRERRALYKDMGSRMFGGTLRADLVVFKVCLLLSKVKKREEAIRIPTQDRRVAFPLWSLGMPESGKIGIKDAWRQAEEKLVEMLVYDFAGLGKELAKSMTENMEKWLISHQVQNEDVYVYFVGKLTVGEDFVGRPYKRACWLKKTALSAMVKDSKANQGAIPISTRVLANALREQLFGNKDLKITVLGETKVQTKEQTLDEVECFLKESSEAGGEFEKGKSVLPKGKQVQTWKSPGDKQAGTDKSKWQLGQTSRGEASTSGTAGYLNHADVDMLDFHPGLDMGGRYQGAKRNRSLRSHVGELPVATFIHTSSSSSCKHLIEREIILNPANSVP